MAGFEAATLVHPEATVGGDVRLAEGVILAAGAQVTTNVSLGRHSQLNVGRRASPTTARWATSSPSAPAST